MAWLVFPGAVRRVRRRKSEARFWAELALKVARSGSFARSSGLYDLLSLDDVSADGEIRVRIRVNSELQDVLKTLHTGAAALVADEVTTASIMSQRCYPGVSILLSVSRAADCAAGSVVHVTSRILRQGRKLIHTEAVFKAGPEDDASVLLVCSHVKFCEAPSIWLPLLWLRTSIARLLLKSFVVDRTRPLSSPWPQDTTTSAGPIADAFTPEEHKAYYTAELPHNLMGFEQALASSVHASGADDPGRLKVVLQQYCSNAPAS